MAKDLTTGKDVAYDVQMIAPPTPRGTGLSTPRSIGGLTPRSARSPLPADLPFGLPLQQQQAATATAAQAAATAALTRSPGTPLSPLAAAAAAALPSPGARSASVASFPIPVAAPSPSAGRQLHYGQQGPRSAPAANGFGAPALATSHVGGVRDAAPGGAGAAGQRTPSPNAAPPPGEELLPGRVQGTVMARARGPRRAALDDGLLAYADAAGAEQTAAYGNWNLEGGMPQLEVGDAVEFQVRGEGWRKQGRSSHLLG